MNTSGLRKGAFVKKADLKTGELYCVTYKHRPDGPCTFAKYDRVIMGDLFLFKRVDLPGENSPNFDPYEPLEIGGRAADLKIYKAISGAEDPVIIAENAAAPARASSTTNVFNNNNPTGGSRRRRRTQRRRKAARKATRRARK